MTLEAAYLGDASMAPREYLTITSSAQVDTPLTFALNEQPSRSCLALALPLY